MPQEILISHTVIGLDGREYRIDLAAPVFEEGHDWHCLVSIPPRLIERKIVGASPFQALSLALNLVDSEYYTQVERGLFPGNYNLTGLTPGSDRNRPD